MARRVTPVALTGADQQIQADTFASYHGFSIRETAGATATVRIYDNASANSGTLLDSIQLNANESAREWYGAEGIDASDGIRVDIVSGTVEGSIRVGR